MHKIKHSFFFSRLIAIPSWSRHLLLLYYYFTKKRLLKIFKIEKINRQLIYKNVLIFKK